jgi:NifU-like protein
MAQAPNQATSGGFSQKIMDAAGKPKKRGAYFLEDAKSKDLALVEAKYKDIKLYWLVQPSTDVVHSARFFAYGGTLSLAIGETLCTLAEGKTIDHIAGFSTDDVEGWLRDKPNVPALENPSDSSLGKMEAIPSLLQAMKEAYPKAKALAEATLLAKGIDKKPTEFESLSEQGEAWLATPKEAQLEKIETVLNKDVRPGLNTDGGDITVLDLEEGHKIHVRWEGACGGCSSSAGATLSYVESKLRSDVFEGIEILSA